jgi:hypothetical protein
MLPDLQGMKLPELKQLGENLGIPKAKYLSKPQLVAAISELGGGSSAGAPSKNSTAPDSDRPSRSTTNATAATGAPEAATKGKRGRPSKSVEIPVAPSEGLFEVPTGTTRPVANEG